MNKLLRVLIFALLTWIPVSTAWAQDSLRRPKIGLVLSGGGAKGMAHVGVLKVLEANGIKVDYIGGTSMGAVVGGVYAAGYNAHQIDSIFRTVNFDQLMQDYVPRDAKNFYSKRQDEMYALSLPFDKFKLSMPRSFVKGVYMYNLMVELLHDVHHVRDFNQLPIPFFCMAADIETGEGIQLNRGFLPEAIRASAAIPSVFSPVDLDGCLLVDGGIADNYPIEKVRAMGADIIIGVDVQDDLKDRTYLQDATSILLQLSNLEMIKAMQPKRGMTDVYIKPDITDYNMLSFEYVDEIIKKGEDAALLQVEKLKALGLVQTDKTFPGHEINQDSLNINRVHFSRMRYFNRDYIYGKLGFQSGDKISYQDLKVGMNNLNATQNFSQIHYTVESNENGQELLLDLAENPVQTNLKFGLHFDSLYKSGILINLTHKRLLTKNDVVSADVILGDNIRYNFDYYIDRGFHWSFGLRSKMAQFSRNTSLDLRGQNLSETGLASYNVSYMDFSHQAYVQTLFIQKFLVGAGVEYKHLRLKSNNFEDNKLDDSNYLNVFGYFTFDGLDDSYFPSQGGYSNIGVTSYLYSSDYTNSFERFTVVQAHFRKAKRILPKLTFVGDIQGGFSLGPSSVPYFNFVLGGYGFAEVNNLKPFFGYDYFQIHGDSYIKAGATLNYEVLRKQYVTFSYNAAQLADNLFDTTDWLSSPKYNGFAAGYSMQTVIGPVEAKYAWSPEHSKGFWWFTVGFKF